ncbi:MAG TPA: SDR family oxidoreductase [Chloroflexota bacterium]|nr:SDR family oxidoreductase [Chloroflexota bacterium]
MAQPANAYTRSAYDNGHSPEIVTRVRHLLVIGATRHTGTQVMQQALAAGHMVTALARDPARIEVQHERLRVVRGDVLDPATLAPAMAGCDAVVSTLGATSAYRAPTTLYSDGMRNIIQIMRTAGIARLVTVTAAPLGPEKDDTLRSRVINKMLWTFIKELYSDMARMEDVIRASGLDWTIVRPPKLTNKPPTGHYRTAINRGVRGGYTIGRADLAAAILTLLDDPTAIHAAIGIAY